MTLERLLRYAGPVVVALFVLAALLQTLRPAGVALGAAAIGVATVLALGVLGATGSRAVAGLVVVGGCTWVICSGTPGNIGWFTTCLLVGWCGFVAPRAPTVALTAAAVVGFGVELWHEPDEPGWGPWAIGTVATAVACLMTRRQRELLTALEAAQADLAVRAAAEERNRIAHELHDVIGHALTVSLLHVTSARLALDDDPAEAAAPLAEAERLGQQSLAEVRAVVGLMKDAGSHAPLPGAGELDDLVASFARSGQPVDWSVTGDPGSLTATEGLTVYRILQEALTNAARHAPGAATAASVVVDGGGTRVVVDSAARPHAVVREGGGLVGMRQRAEAVGGRLTAGPHAGGWRVEAVLPL